MRAWRSRSDWLGRLCELSAVGTVGSCGNEDAVPRAVRGIELNAMPMRGGWIERNSVSVCHFGYSNTLSSFACRRRAAQL